MADFAITPKNFWLFFGGIWLFVGGIFLTAGIAMFAYQILVAPRANLEDAIELLFVGAAVSGVGGTLVFKALAKRKMERELLRHGMPAEATITEIAPANIRINRVQQWAIHYRYQDAYGKSHDDSHLIAPEEAPKWQVGQHVAVRYDSHRPHLHVWMDPTP